MGKFLRRFLPFILLFFSVILNVFLWRQWELANLRTNAVYLNPVNLRRYDTELTDKNLLNKNKTRVVFFGDSRSEQWVSPEVEGFEFFNRGISGETSGQGYLRFFDHVSYLQPQVIVLQLGVNDLRMKPLPSRTYEDIVENCQQNIANLIKKAQTLSATVIVTPLFPLAEGSLPLKWQLTWPSLRDIEAGIQSINQFIRTLDNPPHVIVLDTDKILTENGKLKPEYAQDLLHLNQKGYEVLNQALIQQLQKGTNPSP